MKTPIQEAVSGLIWGAVILGILLVLLGAVTAVLVMK